MSSDGEFGVPQYPATDAAAPAYEPPAAYGGQAQHQVQAPPQYQGQPQYQGAPQYQGQPQYQAAPQQVVMPKNPALGVILSFFIPGLGSIVNGSTSRGVTILVVYVVGVILSFFLIGIPVVIGAWVWGLVDGYQSAQRWNQEHGIVS